MTTIELQDDQVALVLNDDLTYEVYIPEGDENDMVPSSALFALAIAVLIKNEDEKFFSIVDAQVGEFLSLELVEDEE